MKYCFITLISTIIVAGGGCACMKTPTEQSLATVPLVEFGNPVPTDGEFILHFPAGKTIPVLASIKGTALSQEAESTLNVTLKQDVYSYKDWASLDRKTWHPGNDVLNVNAEIKIPGPDHPKPGLIKLLVDLK